MALVLQCGAFLLILAAVPLVPRLPAWTRTAAQRGSILASRWGGSRWFVLGAALTGMLSSVAITTWRGPIPYIHDELSYILAAETFAAGRLTNPPHPLHASLESVHIITQPTMQSKYPPAHSLAMALGKVLFGNFTASLWLITAATFAALAWMLQVWGLRGGAFAGTLIASSFLVFSYWGQTYFTTLVSVLGGALVLGGVRQLARQPTVKPALLLVFGIWILANSRPFEGALLTAVSIGALGWSIKCGYAQRKITSTQLLPIGAVLGLGLVATFVWMGYYNFRVTGDPLIFPYVLHDDRYMPQPVVLWQQYREGIATPNAHIAKLYDRHVADTLQFEAQIGSIAGLIGATVRKFWDAYRFFLGPILLVPFLVGITVLAGSRLWDRLVVTTLALAAFCLSSATFWLPHYSAPFVGALLLVVLAGLARLRTLWNRNGTGVGLFFVASLIAVTLVTGAAANVSFPASANLEMVKMARDIRATMANKPGKNVVFVSGYKAGIDLGLVYNRPDIDTAQTVWVWDLSQADNQRVLDYFPDRKAWVVKVDSLPVKGVRAGVKSIAKARIFPLSVEHAARNL